MSALWDFPAGNVVQARALIGLLNHLQYPNALQPIRSSASALVPDFRGVTIISGTSNFPASAVLRWDRETVILFLGIQNLDQGTAYLQTAGMPADVSFAHGINTYALSAASRVLTELNSLGVNPASRFVVAGHSFGGVSAIAMSLLLSAVTGRGPISCVTFGQPAPGPSALRVATATLDYARLINPGDPVPLVIPRPNQAPSLYAAVSQDTARNWIAYDHIRPALVIQDDGALEVEPYTTGDLSGVQMNLATWLLSLARNQLNAHSIASYVTKLGTTPRDQLSPRAPQAEPLRNHSSNLERENQAAKDLQRLAPDDVLAIGPPALILDQSISPNRFRAVRVNRTWQVQYAGGTVALCKTRGRARGIASAGNRFLKSLSANASIDASSLFGALGDAVGVPAVAVDPNPAG